MSAGKTAEGGMFPPMPVLFPTLASAGYTDCRHPRRARDGHCCDCGARPTGRTPSGEVVMEHACMSYPREPLA